MAARRRLTFEPLVPSPLDYVGLRPFAFYPRIKNLEPNEWTLGIGSWTEVQAVNARTGHEIWIARQYIGAVSESVGRTVIVGLRKELEYHDGILEPCIKSVIEMPHNMDDAYTGSNSERRVDGPAPVIGIRVENRENSPMNKALVALGIAFIVSFLAFAISVLTRA